MKKGTPNHPKTKDLARRLKIERFGAVGILDMLWLFAQEYAPAGDIGKFSDEYLADEVGWPQRRASVLIEALVDSGWLDRNSEHRLIIHDWADHCEDSVHKKLARSFQLFADGSIPKYGRLSGEERAHAEAHYASLESARRAPESARRAPESARRAPSVRPKNAPARPSLAIPSHAKPSQSLAKPEPPAAAKPAGRTPPPESPSKANGWPATERKLRELWLGIDDAMIEKIITAALAVQPGIPDADLAACVVDATSNRQRSPALYLTTVPEVIRTRLALRPPPPACRRCSDSGIRYKLGANEDVDGWEGREPCDCSAGAEYRSEYELAANPPPCISCGSPAVYGLSSQSPSCKACGSAVNNQAALARAMR